MYVKNQHGIINHIPHYLELTVMENQMGRGLEVLSLSREMLEVEKAQFDNPTVREMFVQWRQKAFEMYPNIVSDDEYANKGNPTSTKPTNYDFDTMTKKEIAEIAGFTGDLRRITKDELILAFMK